jgi:hypothetical protein
MFFLLFRPYSGSSHIITNQCGIHRFSACRARTTSAVLTTLDAKLASLAAEGVARRIEDEEHERAVQATLKEVSEGKKAAGGKKGGAADAAADAMDVDDEVGAPAGKAKSRKCVCRCYADRMCVAEADLGVSSQGTSQDGRGRDEAATIETQ